LQAAFNIGTLIRWLDFNDTWLAAEWGHPSDNLGGLLAVAITWRATPSCRAGPPPSVRALLTAMIKAHEIQGGAGAREQLQPAWDSITYCWCASASTAVAAGMLGAGLDQIVNAVSNAWIDGGALRTTGTPPTPAHARAGPAGDATSRGVRHALMALTGEMGYPFRAVGKDLGLLRRALQGQGVLAAAALRQLRHGERAVQDLLPAESTPRRRSRRR